MTVTIRAMQAYVVVCSTGSITRASSVLNVAQPALSLMIRNLELQLGATLLIRSSRGVVPNAAGQRFLESARDILERIDAASRDVRGSETSPHGIVSIALPASIARIVANPLLAHALSHWPDLFLKIIEASTGYIPAYVKSAHVDLGITFSDASDDELISQHVVDEDLVLISPPGPKYRHRADRSVTMEQMTQLRFVLPAEPHSLRRLIDGALATSGLRLGVVAEMNTIDQLVRAVSCGLAHSILSQASVAEEERRGEVTVRRIHPSGMRRSVHLCRRRSILARPSEFVIGDRIIAILQEFYAESRS